MQIFPKLNGEHSAEAGDGDLHLCGRANGVTDRNILTAGEAYDISNLGAEHITAGMIVCENGKFVKKDYRTFTIRETKGAPDDYASMKEALRRRLDHILNPTGSGFGETPPDLILLDGGKGQVSAVLPVVAASGLAIPVFGMVKDDRHRTRSLVTPQGNEIAIVGQQSVFSLIGTIQEETHRFAITYHQNLRNKRLRYSELDSISGIGQKRKQDLLKTFKSLQNIKKFNPSLHG